MKDIPPPRHALAMARLRALRLEYPSLRDDELLMWLVCDEMGKRMTAPEPGRTHSSQLPIYTQLVNKPATRRFSGLVGDAKSTRETLASRLGMHLDNVVDAKVFRNKMKDAEHKGKVLLVVTFNEGRCGETWKR